jgi:hypothetical protein
MKYKIKGIADTREVSMNKFPLNPRTSQKIVNHSPDGFNWGYGGSGPSQLALSILMHACENENLPIENAIHSYQQFKADHIVGLTIDKDFEIDVDLTEYLREISS